MVTTRPAGSRGIDEILADARGRLRRLTPEEAFRERAEGAVLIDIRPAAQRAGAGEIPGSVIVERNHLEWRLDPGCEARLPWVTGYDHRIVVFCVDGYTSSLAAVALHDLGLHRATDLIGGFRAWSAAGFPTAPAGAGTVTLAPGAAPVVLPAVLSRSPPGALDAPPSLVAPSALLSPGRCRALWLAGPYRLPFASRWDRPFQARSMRLAATSSSLGLRASSHHCPANATMPTSICAYNGASLWSWPRETR
jgi:rhodanese-related sulfurtransferase